MHEVNKNTTTSYLCIIISLIVYEIYRVFMNILYV